MPELCYDAGMQPSGNLIVPVFARKPGRRCLSCGAEITSRRRHYCSVDCRQKLRRSLAISTGLLQTLNARYATFFFTDAILVLDLLPYDRQAVFSFIQPRSGRRTPAEDFFRMSTRLGNHWWAEKERTRKRYLASIHLLKMACRQEESLGRLNPREKLRPTLIGNSLVQLRLRREDLSSPELPRIVKSAFRRQALRHHPDHGGSSAMFQKLHAAYEQILEWAENPTFVTRRGFPDRWFYDGRTNRWVQPMPPLAGR
jgi:hypothetical protein